MLVCLFWFRRGIVFLAVLTAAFGPLRAEVIDIEVAPNDWGGADLENIRLLLASAAEQFPQHAIGRPLPPIYIFFSTESPIVLTARSKHGRVQIGLATGGTYWAQYTYQFSHEFVHLLIRHVDPTNEEEAGNQPATWLEETLCEVGSLFALRSMAQHWKTKPPYPNWAPYSDALWVYAEDRIKGSEELLRRECSFVEWFKTQEASLQQNAGNRESNTIIAVKLLPFFEQSPRSWSSLLYYARAKMCSSDTVSEKFSKWAEACPPHLRDFVTELSGVFK